MTRHELSVLARELVAERRRRDTASAVSPQPPVAHPSHALYLTVVNADAACVIEPAVPCDHCGYCKSHGH